MAPPEYSVASESPYDVTEQLRQGLRICLVCYNEWMEGYGVRIYIYRGGTPLLLNNRVWFQKGVSVCRGGGYIRTSIIDFVLHYCSQGDSPVERLLFLSNIISILMVRFAELITGES